MSAFQYDKVRASSGQDPILSEVAILRVAVMLPQRGGALTSAQLGAESEAESQERRVPSALTRGSLSKAGLATQLGLQTLTGALSRSVRRLLDTAWIEYSLPDKPNSRLQTYRLTPSGPAYLRESVNDSEPCDS